MNGLRVVVLVKQVPGAEVLDLDATGRLRRASVPLEMNAYCRRALAKGVELSRSTGGRCTVVTLGPPPAEAVLREALAWGADEAVLVSDPAFAGSDTLATARALAAVVARLGPCDLVLVGRSSLDAETGQVGPELAELLDLPFAGAVRHLDLDLDPGGTAGGAAWGVRVRCEQDDGGCELALDLPAVLAVAERLCQPAKVPEATWSAVAPDRVRRLTAADLGSAGPWGAAGSPTRVEAVRALPSGRAGRRLTGPVEEQVDAAVAALVERGAVGAGATRPEAVVPGPSAAAGAASPAVGVLAEPGRPQLTRELLGAAALLAPAVRGYVVAVTAEPPDARELWTWGADVAVELVGAAAEEDVAAAVRRWAHASEPAVLLSPATCWGREVASRVAAGLGAGLVGDALGLELHAGDGRLVCTKPACAGSTVAQVVSSSAVQMATVRPGVLPAMGPRAGTGSATVARVTAAARGRVLVRGRWRDDDLTALARAEVAVGVGLGVPPERYADVRRLAAVLGGELVATRKVTDRSWLPRSRQVGVTGRSIAPRLYVAVGLSGKLNHMAGVRGAGTVLAINHDAGAPVFDAADVGIVAPWEAAVPLLADRLAQRRAVPGRPAVAAGARAGARGGVPEPAVGGRGGLPRPGPSGGRGGAPRTEGDPTAWW